MVTIPSALRDEVDSLFSAIPINHIKFPSKKNRGFLKYLEQTNIRLFASQIQQKNPSHSLSREEIAACWVARVNKLWTTFEYQSGSHDAEIHRPKFHEALLQLEKIPFYTRAELYVDRMMNPELSFRKLAKKRAAERKVEKSMQDSLSLMLGDFSIDREALAGLEAKEVTDNHFTEKDRELLDQHERNLKQNTHQVIMNNVTVNIPEKDLIERSEEGKELKRKQPGGMQQTQYQRCGQKRKTKKRRQRLKLAIDERSADSMVLGNLDNKMTEANGLTDRPSGQNDNRQRQRPQDAEPDSSDLEDLICNSDTAEADSEDVKMLF